MSKEFSVGFRRFAAVAAIMVSCMAATGCRRTDVRDFEVAIPALSAENEEGYAAQKVRYGGADENY